MRCRCFGGILGAMTLDVSGRRRPNPLGSGSPGVIDASESSSPDFTRVFARARIASSFSNLSRASVARLMLLTDKRLDRQCEYRVEKARRFLSQSRFQRPRTEGGDHTDAEEEEGRKEEALDHVVYVERRGRAALPQVCLPL